jgi:hypothetical protein
MEAFYWEACCILGGTHVWHITCIYLVILLYFGISLEGKLAETLLPILGRVKLFISWSFAMVKTQNPNFPLSPWICFVGGCPLTILGFDYFILHIHPWSWLSWDLHTWIGCMHFVDQFLFLEVGYGAFS